MCECLRCAASIPDGARFCPGCGTEVTPRDSAPHLARRTVTIVFSDLEGSTQLGERVDPESLRALLGRYFGEMRAVIERHGGAVEKFIGDAVMAVFGVPVLREDDALRAVRAAAEMRAAQDELNAELDERFGVRLRVRTGVNTGEVVVGDAQQGQPFATGDAVNVAARLEQTAQAGEILIGQATYDLVRGLAAVEPLEPLELKGKAEHVAAYRLVGVDGLAGARPRADGPLVGRAGELALLEQALAHAMTTCVPRRVEVVGPPGVGKSRLVDELLARAPGHVAALRAACPPYGEGMTLWPVAQVLRQAAGILERDDPVTARERLDGLAGGDRSICRPLAVALGLADERITVDEITAAVGELLARLAADRPLVIVIDDMQWAQPGLDDLLARLTGADRAMQLLLITTARPDDGYAAPPGALELGPLNDEQSAELIAASSSALDAGTAAAVLGAARGNPLYVRELVRMLDEQGGSGAALAVPPTLGAIIAARLDVLGPAEHEALAIAAVIGEEFSPEAVAALAEHGPAGLDGLSARGIVQVGTDGTRLRFSHLMVRDVAYGGLLKGERHRLHARFATHLEREAAGRSAEIEEIVGFHLERAFDLRAELGPLDGEAAEIGARAGEHLAAAGLRAIRRADLAAAVALLTRADRLATSWATRRDLVLALSVAQRETAQLDEARATLRRGVTEALAAGDVPAEQRMRVGLAVLETLLDVGPGFEHVHALALGAVGVLEAASDHAGCAEAWLLAALASGGLERHADGLGEAEAAARHAASAGDGQLEAEALSNMAMALVHGPVPVSEALVRCTALRDRAQGRPGWDVWLGTIEMVLATLHGYAGDAVAARAGSERARALADATGADLLAVAVGFWLAEAEMAGGDLARAAAALSESHARLTEMNETGVRSTIAAWRADVECRRGADVTAVVLPLIAESRELGVKDDRLTQVAWRVAEARAQLALGDAAAAQQIAIEAADIADLTDDLVSRGHARLVLAEVLAARECWAEAAEAASAALAAYANKGAVAYAARARAALTACTRP